MKALKQFFIGLLASIGGLVVLMLVVVIVGALWVWPLFEGEDDQALPDRFVLYLNMPSSLDEVQRDDGLEQLLSGSDRISMFELVRGLDRAKDDPRVTGVQIDLSAAAPGLAQAQEVRGAIFRLRASGKPVQVFAESFEGRRATLTYYLASAADQIWLQPSGLLDMRGLALDIPFFKRLLDDWGVTADFQARHEFKGAASSLTAAGLPKEQRQNLERLVDSMFSQITEGIAVERNLSVPTTRQLVDRAPFLAVEAKRNALIDRLGYRDEFRADAGDAARRVGLQRYLATPDPEEEAVQRIAVIAAEGAISRGAPSRLRNEAVVTPGQLVRALKQAREDASVRAIILRIDSPGGSYVASDTIVREISLTRAAGLPVVASMGDSAASGGYMLAIAADHLVAQPGSITGSIGVVGGKVAVGDMLRRQGVDFERVSAGRNAGMHGIIEPYGAQQRARMASILDAIYDDFTHRAATARRLSARELDAVARGRVWTGVDAREVGLVDVLGGYAEAMALAREAASISAEEKVQLTVYPRPRPILEKLLDFATSGDLLPAVRVAWSMAAGLVHLGRISADLGLTGSSGAVNARALNLDLQ